MSRRSVASKSQQNDFAARFATDFETEIVRNKVRDVVGEDDELARLCDAAAAADAAGDLRQSYHGEDAEFVEKIERSQHELDWVAHKRALEAVTEACAAVVEEGDEWAEKGDYSDEDVQKAVREAQAWLQVHSNEGARASVDYASVLNTGRE